ncbi:hypothetical protein A9Q84_15465 [Halobacteriovorax marinus]|uniref:Secreted protein n=1 Tax=Halobacteriovorax marinus TaxID=97084 RepID=A0A1Y5F991_9BACT|nr:hypothetical protein A9Q84_15465 [Halobacteriovorax marinus]
MKAIWPIFLLVFSLNSKADFNFDITFDGPLNKSCPFVKDQNVLTTLESLRTTLEQIRDNRVQCQSIYNNSKAYLNTISSELISRDGDLKAATSNKETLLAEVYKRINAGTYNNELEDEILSLVRQENEYSNQDSAKDTHLLDSLSLGGLLLDSLRENSECDGSLGNTLLRPSLLLMGQVANTVYPGSSLITSGVANGLSSLMDSFVSYAKAKFSNEGQSIQELISAKNYYMSYKCAYKNINIMSCTMRDSAMTKDELKDLYKDILELDTEEKDFRALSDMRKHYPRVTLILQQLKDIYETSQQQETIVEIASIQKEMTRLRLLRPSPYDIDSWTDQYQNIKTWQKWNQNLNWTQYLKEYIATYCKVYSADVPAVWSQSSDECKPNNLLKNEDRSLFIINVVKPSLDELETNLARLSAKLRESVNIERLYYAIKSEENYSERNKDFKFSEILELILSDLDKDNRPEANKLFAIRIKKAIKALDALVKYDGDLVKFENGNENCNLDITDYKCDDFKSLAQAAYTYLANNLSGGEVLSVETIDATFYNYMSGVEDFFLNGTDTKTSLKFSKYNYLTNIYRVVRATILNIDSEGTADLPLMNIARKGFEKVFGYEIVKMLEKDVKVALDEGSKSDIYRDAIHSCAIYFPLLERAKELSTNLFKRKRMKKVAKKCEKLLKRNGGIPYLIASDEKFPLKKDDKTYKHQCYYKEYESDALIKKVTLGRDIRDDDDLPEL